MPKQIPTPEKLRELLMYDPDTGVLTWRDRSQTVAGSPNGYHRFNGRNAGKIALNSLSQGGYFRGTVMYVNMQAHRVAWAVHYGEHPAAFVDHINGVKTDNRITNLRLATITQNSWNNRGRAGSSVFKGVCLRESGRWHARVVANGITHLAGDFDTEREAALAHDDLARKVHGEFAWLNADHHILSRGRE